MEGLATLIFTKYVFAFEITGALLITAAVGAMVLTHRERTERAKTQRELAEQRVREGKQRPAAAGARRLRPAQRGGHRGPAARRHPVRAHRQPDAARARPDPGRAPTRGARRPRRRWSSAPRNAWSATATEPATCQADRGGGQVNPVNYLYLAALLFTIGATGVLIRRNAIVVFMCVELMLNACNLAFVTFSRLHGNLDGQIIAFFTMVVAAAEVVVGPGDHRVAVPLPPLGLGRRRQPDEAVRGRQNRGEPDRAARRGAPARSGASCCAAAGGWTGRPLVGTLLPPSPSSSAWCSSPTCSARTRTTAPCTSTCSAGSRSGASRPTSPSSSTSCR